ncbi:MAG TPA: hypothetical protein VNM36_10550, partial [Gemmatimonadaceae bacterium]|nr:hypothetical protein [Gemmatimonadaceae bacterium]
MTAIHTPDTAVAAVTPETSSDAEALLESARRIAPIIREHAETTERQRRVAKPVLDALASAGFNRLLAP